MSTIRIAVASTPLTATLDEAVPVAVAAVEAAARAGARIVCLPETGLPGHRMQARAICTLSSAALDAAVDEIAAAARRAGIVTLVGVERPTPGGREIVQVVLDADGARLGEQVKTQMHPDEELHYCVGAGRRVFTAGGATFGIAICHEVYRYPETVRALARAGAQIVFAPYFVTTSDRTLPLQWCDPRGSYHEKALLCRTVENEIYVAAANFSVPDQGAATCILGPDGALMAQVPYGQTGVATADIDLARATRAFAAALGSGTQRHDLEVTAPATALRCDHERLSSSASRCTMATGNAWCSREREREVVRAHARVSVCYLLDTARRRLAAVDVSSP